jgi:hypothetical protein
VLQDEGGLIVNLNNPGREGTDQIVVAGENKTLLEIATEEDELFKDKDDDD